MSEHPIRFVEPRPVFVVRRDGMFLEYPGRELLPVQVGPPGILVKRVFLEGEELEIRRDYLGEELQIRPDPR